METETVYTIKSVKDLGAKRCRESLDLLLDLYKRDLPVDVKREVVSSIGIRTR